MRIGLIADVHANHTALRAVLGVLQDVDLILCAGDLSGYFTSPNEVITDILERDIIFVTGNHDHYLAHPPANPNAVIRQSLEYTLARLRPDYKRLLSTHPAYLHLTAGGLSLAVYHASPWDPLEEYIYPDHTGFDRFTQLPADVIILGHTHYPMTHWVGGKLIINPGSSGQPRDEDKRPACAVLDTHSMTCDIIRVPYDVDQVAAKVRASTMGPELKQYLLKYLTKEPDQ
jgi:predicted phosphodiesterase